MLHFSRGKMLAILAVCLASFLFALPNFLSKETVAGWPKFLQRQITLGLDLQGGAHLLMQMKTDDVRKDWLENVRSDARRVLRDAKIGFTALGVQGGQVRAQIAKPEEFEKALTELRKLPQSIGNALVGSVGYDLTVETAGGEPGTIVIQPTEAGQRSRITNAIDASIAAIGKRIDGLGTSEASIVRQGADRILIQYPGLRDTKLLKELLNKTAKLTFHAVHPQTSGEEAKQSGRVPPGYKVYPSAENPNGSYLLLDAHVVGGDELVDAQPGLDSRTGEPIISFRFNQAGARKFGKWTGENVGQPFAILLDGKVLSAPVVREAILGGSGQISGSFTIDSANALAISLRSGALPASFDIVEERSVGPSLGADSIAAGTRAGMIGALATIVLTTLAYGTFGIYAVIALLINGLMIVAIMTLMGSTLTLPGIAGLVLTIGMAVDANVLIYERIREELRAGKSPIAALDAGFTRAIVTIADSQLTTLVAALIMFWLGSGPIRGFAVTLTIGIFTSVFTAVTVTRLLVSLWLKNAKAKSRTIEIPI